jgi:serine/threonine-protein kinase
MSDESDLVDKLAQSIADGGSIDWEEVNGLPADAELRRLVNLFRIVANVGDVHRSAPDAVRPSDEISTKPGADLESRPGPPATPARRRSDALGQWGHLLLLRKIGEGAFGEVYHAHDTWLDHAVALKIFKSKVAGRDPSTRILHEARKLARIRHPNVVSVHGADSHDGKVGFWMDFVDGVTLADMVRSGRLSAGEATSVGQEVCRALAAVHAAEIVHRDIKAQNVMRATDGGRIILMDFGAGEFINDKSVDSRPQGTPLYLAPEIFAGDNASVQSDIYAVGVLLYFLVTGAFPVAGSSVPALIDAHRRGDRRRLRDRRPDLPSSFVNTVEQAINPDPVRRFTSAGEMEAALSETRQFPTPPPPPPVPIVQKQRTLLEKVELAALISAVTIATVELLGLIASRVFEVALGIESDFAAGPIDYFTIGIRAIFPMAVFWLAGAAVLGGLAGLRPLFQAPVAAVVRRWSPAFQHVDADTQATLVFLAGLTCWIAISWLCSDIFIALDALKDGAIPSGVDLSILSSGAISLHNAHGLYSAYLSFLLGVAAWKLFPRLEKVARDRARVQLLKWATVVVALLVVATAVVPRRFIWERFEVVTFEGERAFVIGASPEELLLYSPKPSDPKRWRVRRDAPALRRTATMARIFDPQ